ncbi:MAG TPA: YbhB/YbcL family Raf kinase inhibitor-like protein [Candidatus Obscuribacterales bacterium]
MSYRLLNAALLTAGLLLLSACPPGAEQTVQVSDPSASASPMEVKLMGLMQITSKAFANGQAIPERFSCKGANVSPPLNWVKVPKGTRSLALIMDDPDAPAGTWLHWVLYNVPPEISQLPDDLPPNETLSLGALQGLNDFKKMGYGGPCPPAGQLHRYFFRLFALDAMLPLEPGATRAQLEAAMKGHILGRGELMGGFKQ